jgi:hypothetical protein
MPRSAALPFNLKRSQDVLGSSSITTTTETVHGLLRLDGDRLVIQWRLARKTEFIGNEIRTDREVEAVREVVVPLDGVAGASLRRSWLGVLRAPRLVLTAADLQAFEAVAGEGGLRLKHPAELIFRVRRSDGLLAEEFAAELTLAVAEHALKAYEARAALTNGEVEQTPGDGSPAREPGSP